MISSLLSSIGITSSSSNSSSVPAVDVSITHELVRSWLTLDSLWRRRRRWPLLQGAQLETALHSSVRCTFADDVVATKSRPLGAREMHNATADGVLSALCASFVRLQAVLDASEGHVLIAGGAVVKVLQEKNRYYDHEDVDMFFFGLSSEQEATRLLHKICSEAFPSDSQFSISEHCVTATCNDRRYQFILRLYDTPDQILGGFDLPCCAVGVSPSLGLVATPLAAFNLITGTIFVDTSRRSTTFLQRLAKYSHRQFSIVFSIKKDVLKQEENSTWYVQSYTLRHGYFRGSSYYEEKSDYDSSDVSAIHYWANIKRAADPLRAHEIVRSGATFEQALNNPQILGTEGLEKLYAHRIQFEKCNSSGMPVVRIFQAWFGPDAAAFFAAKVADDRDALEAIKDRAVARIRANFEAAKRAPLRFITIDPGRQYTGSFNPIFEHPTKFYGQKFYRPMHIGMTTEMRALVWRICKDNRLSTDVFRYMAPFVAFAVALDSVEKCGFGGLTRIEKAKEEV